MKKITNYHHKSSSDYISKKTKNIKLFSTVELESNAMNIKIGKISNSDKDLSLFVNSKIINGCCNGKDFQENKKIYNTYFKNYKKEEEKNSLKLDSKEDISVNNLTEYLQINNNNSDYSSNISQLLKSNININKKISNINLRNSSNNNINSTCRKNFPSINISNKLQKSEKKGKNSKNMKQIKVKTTIKNKKCLNVNNGNIIKKSLIINLNKDHNNNDNINNNKENKATRKFSNLTEGKGSDLIPLKSKTQNYFNNNFNLYINNYYSNKKKQTKNNDDNFNKSYENNIKNNLISSKKKLFISTENNNDNNIPKKKINNNDIKFKQKNVLLLKGISNAQKILKTTSPNNKNINIIKHNNNSNKKKENFKNNKILYEGENTYMNNFTISEEMNNKKEEVNYTDRLEYNKDHKEMKDSKNNSEMNLLKKNNIFTNKKIVKKSLKAINKKNVNNISSIKKGKKINLNIDNLIISKKKENSHNSLINKNLNKKELKLDNLPIINKVLIFQVGNNKISKNNLNISNSNINDNSDIKKKSHKSLIVNSDQKIENKKTNNNNNNIDDTPKKKKIADIIQKNLKFNREKNLQKKQEIENKRDHEDCETSATPPNSINTKNFEINNNKNNNNINGSNTTNKTIKTKPKEEKEFCEMETPILLNTPKLTERVFDAKLNLFERVKNMKIKNTNFNKNNITNNSYSSSENSDIIHQDISNSFNAQKNALNAINTLNNLKKRKSSLKKNFFSENSIIQVLFLEEKFISKILDFLDINIINIISKNKKCCKIIKPIINKKIKTKILDYYFTKKYINYFNKIKKSLISYSSLSKLSPILLHKKYVDLLLENNQKYDQEIQKDLTRTFPNNSSFKYGNDNYNKLYHLLTVYSLFNQKIGYAQGINFIAANIILLMPKEKEEKIFMFLDGLIEKFEFGKLFGLNVGDHLKKKLNNLEQNLSKFCPEIIKFLEISNLSHEFFTTNWMLTLFANSMENKYLFIVWDFLIIFGWKFFIFFVISILNKFKNEIRKVEQNNLTYFMKNLFKSKIFEKNFKNIIDETIDLINKGYNF